MDFVSWHDIMLIFGLPNELKIMVVNMIDNDQVKQKINTFLCGSCGQKM